MEESKNSRVRPFRRLFTRVEALGLYLISGFLVCGVVVLLFGFLSREVFRTTDTRAFDREVTLAMRELQSPGNDRLARIVTFFGGHLFVLPATLVVTAALWLKHHRASALLFAGSVVGGFGLNALLKVGFARERPDLWPALVTEVTYSFPSGHATMATVFFGGAAAVVIHLSRRPLVRAAALVLATTAILMVAASRVYLGAHWTTDVAGGVLVGLFWVSVCSTGTEYVSRRVAASARASTKATPSGEPTSP